MLQREHNTLRHKTIIGLVWAGISRFGSQGIHFIVLLGLAWKLTPTEFGLMGLVNVFVLFTMSFARLGLAAAIVQQSDTSDDYLCTAFWMNSTVGVVLGILSYFGADPITRFLGDIAAAPLLRVLSILFPISALAIIPTALLEKELDFRSLTYREFSGEIAFGIVGLTMAFLGFGVWSLVGASVAQRLVSTFTLWIAVPWYPKFTFNYTALRKLLGFGFYSMLSDLLSGGLANVDYFIIGRWLGTEALGFYTLAFQLSMIPERRLVDLLKKVTFPSFSIVQDNIEQLRNGFVESVKYLFLVLAPVSSFIAVLAPWFIQAAYGDKWMASVNSLRILTVCGLFYGFSIADSIYYAVGQPKITVLILGMRTMIFGVLVYLFGLSSGIEGIAVNLTLSFAFSAFIGFILVSRIIQTSMRKLFKPVWQALKTSIFACLPAFVVYIFSIQAVEPWLMVIGLGTLMALTYLFILVFTMPDLIARLRLIVKRIFQVSSS